MPDHARSDDPAVQTQLDRFAALSPGRDTLGLERIAALMEALGNPHQKLPPVFHVSGTNGKGSTCAFLRAAIEAAGMSAHVYTSPHLVRFNERIRVAGKFIKDEALAPLLAEVLDVAEALDLGPSFFEATTAAALLAFSRTPANACILEVGLGGRLDATNIVERPAVCGISSLGIDHESFLLVPEDGTPDDPLTRIGWEKAGIAKAGVPLVIGHYPAAVNAIIADHAASTRAPLLARKKDWDAAIYDRQIAYRDTTGTLKLPLPRMAGAHQADNAALAIAMLRHQDAIIVPEAALAAAMEWAHWPARLQLLGKGPLTSPMPEGSEIWLDGGHNADAGKVLADALLQDGPITVIMGMLRNKDVIGFLKPLAPRISALYAVPITGHEHHDPKDICQQAQDSLGITSLNPVDNVEVALRRIAENGEATRVLITGSLYLAGEVLKLNDQLPD